MFGGVRATQKQVPRYVSTGRCCHFGLASRVGAHQPSTADSLSAATISGADLSARALTPVNVCFWVFGEHLAYYNENHRTRTGSVAFILHRNWYFSDVRDFPIGQSHDVR
jgi:hypothetical protein